MFITFFRGLHHNIIVIIIIVIIFQWGTHGIGIVADSQRDNSISIGYALTLYNYVAIE